MGYFRSFIYFFLSLFLSLWFTMHVDVSVQTPPKRWFGPGEATSEDNKIVPFNINVSNEVLEDLRNRLRKTRQLMPPLEGIHFEYGFNTDTLSKIIKFWLEEYNWRDREVFLNKYPQFKTKIQGLDIHFLHIIPKNGFRTVPLMILHGWPGSVREFYGLIDYLTEKPIDGADFVFELIIPSLPGYGFSSPAVRPGLNPGQMAIILGSLMTRLGYEQYYLQGGDWGSQIATNIAIYYPEQVKGMHLNLCTAINLKSRLYTLLGGLFPKLIGQDMADKMFPLSEKFSNMLLETGYFHIQATKPDTVGVGLTDSPAGLAAYILEKFSTGTNNKYRSIKDGGLLEKFSYTDLLDNVMIYWITGSITSSMRLYAEYFTKEYRDLNLNEALVNVPTWCSKFRTELGLQPDWMLKLRYPDLRSSYRHEFGGHFIALEAPEMLAKDIWESFVQVEYWNDIENAF